MNEQELDRLYQSHDEKWHALNDQIEAEGYQFEGNVMLPSDSCEEADCCCPMCDAGGYFVVLYHKPDNHDDSVSANQCYDCGHMWRD